MGENPFVEATEETKALKGVPLVVHNNYRYEFYRLLRFGCYCK